jgi:hypothetical protein
VTPFDFPQRFKNLPKGQYIVGTNVTWEVPTAYYVSTQGGFVASFVNINEGAHQEVILTR